MLVALALAFGMILGGVTPAGADTTGATGALGEAGVLRLHLGAPPDQFLFEPVTEEDPTPQAVGNGAGCRLSPTTGALVTLSAATTSGSAVPGFVGDSIGVRGSGNDSNGVPCGRIDSGQSLTLNLVQSEGSALSGKYIDFAEIDLEAKFGATVKIEGFLVQGSEEDSVITQEYSSTGNDSGPDSGDGDNYRVRFPKVGTTAVNKLVFSLVGSTGGTSLEGGSDGTTACDGFLSDGVTTDPNELGCQAFSLGEDLGTTDTLFHLVNTDGFLDCGDPAVADGDGTTRPRSELVRLNNVTGTAAECIPIAFDLDSSADATEQLTILLKDLFDEDAQFEWTVTWLPEDPPEDGSYMEEPTEFDFDGDGNFTPIQLCLPDGTVGDPDGFPDLPLALEVEDPPTPGARDPWCVKFTSTTLITEDGPDNGKVFLRETYFGLGDPTGRR